MALRACFVRTTSTSVRRPGAAAASSLLLATASSPPAEARRWMNMNPNQQQRMTQDFWNAPKYSEYDIDKEKWGKQTKWHTLDCVIDPSIDSPKAASWKGLKKMWKMWLAQRKLAERRPGFEPLKDLRGVFDQYVTVVNTPVGNQQKDLCRVTTWSEAVRIEAEVRKAQVAMEEREAIRTGKTQTKSWKDMAVKKSSAGAASAKKGPPTTKQTTAAKKAAEAQKTAASTDAGDGAEKTSDAKKPTTGDSDEVVPDITTPMMEMKIENFDLQNIYIGQMTSEDWVQVTVKVSGKRRTPKTAPLYETFVEYPVFETSMGDGVNSANNNPFRVVALLDRDGQRYGKDGSDALQLRKSMAQAKSSWWPF